MSMLLVLLLAAAYTDFSWRRGGALGAGFVLKYLPGAAALALILNRDRRALAVFFAVAAVGVLLPWAVLVACFPGPYAPLNPHYWMGTPHPQSWSIPSVALRIADPPRNDGHLPPNWEAGNRVDALHLSQKQALLSVMTGAVVLAVGVGVLMVLCGGKLTREQTPWAMTGLIALSLAAAPVSWTHYQVLQYPGIALLLGDSIRRHAWRSAVLVALLFVMLYPVPYEVFRWFDRHGGLGIGSPAAIYFWTSVAPMASLGVFGVSVRRMRGTVTQI